MAENPVFAARSAVGVACRTGSPEEITAAREALDRAKAERLRADADALLSGIDRSEVRVIGYGDQSQPSRLDHQALVDRQYVETREFKSERGPSKSWSDADHEAWSALLRLHTEAHAALGCSRNANCRMERS